MKSCHWNELKPAREKAIKEFLDGVNFVSSHNQDMEVFPVKYCLFWMITFPKLLLFTWKELHHVILSEN